jgi:multicomponent Na+:H+ antiporter subunit G
MGALEVIGSVLMAIGCVFALTGSFGVLRMPDFYTRLHPAGKSDTLAQGLILVGLALFATQQLIGILGAGEADAHGRDWPGVADTIIKLVLLTGLLFLTAPTATHAIAKAARLEHDRLRPREQEPGSSQVAEIVVPGGTGEPLTEAQEPVLDVDERSPRPSPDTQDGDD